MLIIILEIRLAVVELPQLTYNSYAGGAAASATVGHRVPDDAVCCCGLLQLVPVCFSVFKHCNICF